MKIILLFIGLITLTISCVHKSEYRIYLIPQGFEGSLISIEDNTALSRLNKVKDTIFFDFTKTKIIKFNEKFIEGSFVLDNIRYYYVDSLGNRKSRIPILWNPQEKVDSNQVYIYNRFTQISSHSQCEIISSPANFRKNLFRQQELCDSLFSTNVPH